MIEALKKILPESRIRTRLVDLVSYASDAGFYYLLPRAVVQVVNEAELQALFRFSHQQNIPLVFRTGGTSLSGQSVTDGILVDLSRYWNAIRIEESGATVRVQPGITGGMVNACLQKYGRKIGPDPSSISAAMMGGILSNNSSGMCCGVTFNAYHTTKFIRFILPGGGVFSTEHPADYDRFLTEGKLLADELSLIREELLADTLLYATIRRKYETKNTVGYSLNAFIDYEHPLDIFAHLLIGAEGTLAFIAEAVMHTIPDEPFKSTALLYFPDIFAACKAIVPLKDAGAAMVELMDRASLHAVELLPGMDPFVQTLPSGAAALLIEFQQSSIGELEKQVNEFLASTGQLLLLNAPTFTTDPHEREFFWKLRKGLFPAVGAVRASGTTVILEDVAFPLPVLGEAILSLQNLFDAFDYKKAIIFGHAKDGNIHFVVTQTFNNAQETDRYDRFLKAVVDLVVNKYGGTLKAEHGTGRNMAPFVQTEWGGTAYNIMVRLKAAADPLALLNPGVIINHDQHAHITNLKQMPTVEQEVDRCIECGYCEPVCPSRDITLTPRRRIVVRRSLEQLRASGNQSAYNELLQQYQYDGLDTCAVDGLCANACPVSINTGDLVKRLRRENHSTTANQVALFAAKQFATIEQLIRLALRAGNLLNSITGQSTMRKITQALKKIWPAVPLWTSQILSPPRLGHLKDAAAKKLPPVLTIVYFPACISRLLGASPKGGKSLTETFMELSARAGINVKILGNLGGSCCGQVFSSKGFDKAHRFTANAIVEQLWQSTEAGMLPVVMDVSSCTYTLQHLAPALTAENATKFTELKIMDSIDYLYHHILPLCNHVRKKERIVLHPVCSLKKMGTEHKFLQVAKHFAHEVEVPLNAGCCGMAGDRGFLFPELTAAATFPEAAEVKKASFSGYYSSTKTCEMAMSAAVGKNYESILYLANEALTETSAD